MCPTTANSDLENLEIKLLLDAVFASTGLDFRDYSRSFIRRRVLARVQAEATETVSGLLNKVLHDPECMQRLCVSVGVHVTSMFRNPSFFETFRRKVVPLLRDIPFVRLWHAGCSTGEEVYSMAILLREEGLEGRCRIYATDMHEEVLRAAQSGIFPLAAMQEFTQNYVRSGGKASFSDYYVADHENAILNRSLRKNILFAPHNLVTDSSLNEFHVIMIRNVMIYFTRPLQERVHQLVYQSLAPFGILALGSRESLEFTPYEECYEVLDGVAKLYRRTK